jgi:hypothetical protein
MSRDNLLSTLLEAFMRTFVPVVVAIPAALLGVIPVLGSLTGGVMYMAIALSLDQWQRAQGTRLGRASCRGETVDSRVQA